MDYNGYPIYYYFCKKCNQWNMLQNTCTVNRCYYCGTELR